MARCNTIAHGFTCAALLTLAGCGGGGGGSNGPGAVDVTLARDAWGVPHVFAKSDRAVLYGLGWATAEDRLFQMLRSRLMARGRVAEFFGPGTVGGVDTNVAHDLASRQEGWWRQAQRTALGLDKETRELLEAYALGVSDYMASPTAQLHPLIAQHGIPLEPWSAADCVAVWMRFARHFSSDGSDEVAALRKWEALLTDPNLSYAEAYDLMLAGVVCDDSAAVVQQAEVPAVVQQAMADYAAQHGLDAEGHCPVPAPAPKFSQAWAVAGSRTVSGNAVLVGDPRSPVARPNRFFEWSIEGKTLRVRGVGVPGSPIVLAGSTDRLAWSPTALGLDQADLFSLTTDPVNRPGQYLLDGQWIDYEVDEAETVRVKGAADVPLRYRRTVFGPVVTPLLSGALPGEEFAVRRVPFGPSDGDASGGFFRMARANHVDGFLDALEDWSWPPLNLVFADAGGRVGYSVAGAIPVRRPGLTFAGLIPQDGSSSATDWIEHLPHGLQPHLLDPASGFVFSANHMPIGSWYPIPVRFGNGGAGHTHRSRRLEELLGQLPATVDLFEVAAPRTDTVNPARRDLVELAVWVRDNQPSHPLSAGALSAVTQLEPWWQGGAAMDSADPAVALAWLLDLKFRASVAGQALVDAHGGGENGLNRFLESSLADVRAAPPTPLSTEAVAYLDRVLSEGWTKASALGAPGGWQAWYANNALSFDLLAWATLEQLPPPAGAAAPLRIGPVPCTDGGTLFAVAEQAYTQVVVPGSSLVAQSVTPPGASEHAGAHELDQLTLWEGAAVKPAPLTMGELMAGGGVTTSQLTFKP